MNFKKIPFEQNMLTELSAEQIEAAKKEFGDIYLIQVDGRRVYMHAPDRRIIDLAQTSAVKRPSLFEETILTNCWLAGNKEVLDEANTRLFYAVARKVSEIVQVADAEIKKL